MLSSLKKSLALKVFALLAVAAIVVTGWFLATRNVSGLVHRFVPGQRLVYDLEFMTAATSNLMGLQDEELVGGKKRQALTSATHTNVEGEFVATVLETSAEGGALVVLQLRKASVQIATNGDLALDHGQVIESELQQPVFAEIDVQGRVLKVRFTTDVQPLSQAFARSLIAATQIVLSTDVDAMTWQTREDDPNGKYLATYTRKSALLSDVIHLEKRRESYFPRVRKNLVHKLEADTNVKPDGKVAIEFDGGDGVVLAIAGDEKTTIEVEGRVVARSETTLRLKLRNRESLEKTEETSLRARLGSVGPALALSALGDTAKRETAMHKATLGEDTLDSLLTDLANRQAGMVQGDDTQLYLKLKALIHLQPAVCVQLAKELSVVKVEGPAMAMLSGALSTVGHAQAQTALQVAIRTRANDWSALMFLVPALGMVDAPTPSSQETLRVLAETAADEQVRSTAQLSLGIMARSMATTEPARHRAILQETIKKLNDATTLEARRQNLLVLGNIGADEALSVTKAHLRHEAPQVRSAAAAALRWLEAESVDELLLGVLTNDVDENVRLEAAQALGFRPMTAGVLAGHKSVLAKDSSASVRLALLRNVLQAQHSFSDARGILQDVARNDAVAEVREEANRMLAEKGR